MGIDLQCINESYCCSYSTWYKIRFGIMEATFIYLSIDINEHKLEKDSIQLFYKQHLQKIINELDENYIDNYLDYALKKLQNYESIDALICFGVEGLYAICNKRDTEGFYSVADAYSICELFKIIKPFLLKNMEDINSDENYIYHSVIELEKLFQESFQNKKYITIC